MHPSRTLNLGILAHVDAGKTSLTERLLFDTGTIDRLGRVDAGNTQTDSNDIERQRGITIRTAVASFSVGDLQVNLIDTPGHADFVAEVERALAVLDGAVLVISAVEGVQPQTRILMRTLRRLGLPTLIFVNKIDRVGARDEAVVAEVRQRLGARVVALDEVTDIGSPAVRTTPKPVEQSAVRAEFAEILAECDDALLAELVDDQVPSVDRIETMIATQTASALLHPLYFGSALTSAGTGALLDGVRRFLPPARQDHTALQGRVFAITRGPMGEKLGYLRLDGGQVQIRDRIRLRRRDETGSVSVHRGQVTALQVVGRPEADRLTAGNIAVIGGLPGIRVGDRLGTVETSGEAGPFPPPGLETVVRAKDGGQTVQLRAALLALADQDPLIRTRMLPDGETSLLLYGEVQTEFIAATLEAEFGVRALFEPSRTIYFERPTGTGTAADAYTYVTAELALRVEPGPPGSGLHYQLTGERGTLREGFHRAVEEAVYRTLEQGLQGWSVTDCVVSLTRSSFATGSTAGAYRSLTPLLLMRALEMAGTQVYEPCETFELQLPLAALGMVTSELMAAEARIRHSSGDQTEWILEGEVPARRLHAFRQQIPHLTFGEGVWTSRPGGDRAVGGPPPSRARTGPNPLDTQEYLRHLARRGSPW